jgi:hypothetical protein
LFDGDDPILHLLDEMPPYFLITVNQVLGQGTVADVLPRDFANILLHAKQENSA